MTHAQAFTFASIAITLGGVGLLVLAAHAASRGFWSPALFIGLMGAILLGTVVYGHVLQRKLKTDDRSIDRP